MLTTIVKSLSTRIKLSEIIMEAEGTYTFKFEAPEKIKWSPGAYAHFLSSDLRNGEKVNKDLVRELSIMNHPDEGCIGFTTRIRQNPSEFKRIMLNLTPGDEIRMFKIGNHFKKLKPEGPMVFISMGVGVATFRPLIHEFIKKSTQALSITNINIDRSGDFVYQQELESLPSDTVKNMFVTHRDELYKMIDQCLADSRNTYCIVGSKDFNSAVGDYLLAKNVNRNNIIFDK